ncbi:hypothetical protein WS86_06760 [Burkholderia savannae]|nr:hypothetical protein WS86_06760 [Burkholderia savannae]
MRHAASAASLFARSAASHRGARCVSRRGRRRAQERRLRGSPRPDGRSSSVARQAACVIYPMTQAGYSLHCIAMRASFPFFRHGRCRARNASVALVDLKNEISGKPRATHASPHSDEAPSFIRHSLRSGSSKGFF